MNETEIFYYAIFITIMTSLAVLWAYHLGGIHANAAQLALDGAAADPEDDDDDFDDWQDDDDEEFGDEPFDDNDPTDEDFEDSDLEHAEIAGRLTIGPPRLYNP